jgi:hypothetical protein
MKATPKKPTTNLNFNSSLNNKTNMGKISNFTLKAPPKTNPNSLKNVVKVQETTPKKEIIRPYDTLEATPVTKKIHSSALLNLKTNKSLNSNNMGRVNSTHSTQPFQKIEHDFYVANTERGLWEKELQKNKTEKRIFSEKKNRQENVSNFGGINVVK